MTDILEIQVTTPYTERRTTGARFRIKQMPGVLEADTTEY